MKLQNKKESMVKKELLARTKILCGGVVLLLLLAVSEQHAWAQG